MINWSLEAVNVLDLFYSVDKIVYVEGDDDVRFWEVVFEKTSDITVSVQPVGGKSNLVRYIDDINESTSYLVAMDSDHDRLFHRNEHPKIIKTFGYSIENTLICPEIVCEILKNLARLPSKKSPIKICKDWFCELDSRVSQLVLADVINDLLKLGLSVVPNASDQLMESKSSHTICSKKVNELLIKSTVLSHLSPELSKDINNRIATMESSYLESLRGHFLFSITLKFIKASCKDLGKEVSAIPIDIAYSNFISIFESLFERHKHYEHYKKSILLSL